MSSDGELFQEQVEDALYKKYPVYGMQVRYHFVQMPDWAPLCWDERNFPDKFTVKLLDVEEEFEVACFEVTVGFRIEGDENGRWIEAFVENIEKKEERGDT